MSPSRPSDIRKPGEVLYEGLELASPETGRVVLHCRTLRTGWETAKDEQGQERTVLAISAVEPEIEAVQTRELWQLIDRCASRRTEFSRRPLRGWPPSASRSRPPRAWGRCDGREGQHGKRGARDLGRNVVPRGRCPRCLARPASD